MWLSEAQTSERMDCFDVSIFRDLFQRCGCPREWVVLVYQPVASSRCIFDPLQLQAYHLFYFISSILSSQTFINWSVCILYFHSCLVLLRQISNDNFLKAPLKSTIFKYEQHEYIWDISSGRFRIKSWSSTCSHAKQKYLLSEYPASRDLLCAHEKCFCGNIRDFCS